MKKIMGDYYYEEMTYEEAVEKIFLKPLPEDKKVRCQRDIDNYIRDNMNEKMPLDGPLVRIYFQEYNPEENKDKPKDE